MVIILPEMVWNDTYRCNQLLQGILLELPKMTSMH